MTHPSPVQLNQTSQAGSLHSLACSQPAFSLDRVFLQRDCQGREGGKAENIQADKNQLPVAWEGEKKAGQVAVASILLDPTWPNGCDVISFVLEISSPDPDSNL